MIKKGSYIVVMPTAKGLKKSYPAASWIEKYSNGGLSIAYLLEDAPHGGTLDVLDVQTLGGRPETIYDFNIIGQLIKYKKW